MESIIVLSLIGKDHDHVMMNKKNINPTTDDTQQCLGKISNGDYNTRIKGVMLKEDE